MWMIEESRNNGWAVFKLMLEAISMAYKSASMSSSAATIPISLSDTDSGTTRSLLLFLNLFQLCLLVHPNAKCQGLREQIWWELQSDPMSAKLHLWHKGLQLWLWGEIVCLCIWVCLYQRMQINLTELSPVVAGQYCSAAPLLHALLSHQGVCWLSTSHLQHTASSLWAASFSLSCIALWHTHASHIKDRDVRAGL